MEATDAPVPSRQAREDLITIVWAVLTQFPAFDDVDEATDMVADAIIANGWPRTVAS